MRLARTLRFDESDVRVFSRPAEPGEWAISGGFQFSNWTDAEIVGQARQDFANGWLGLESFGRATFVAVAEITEAEYAGLIDALAAHFVVAYGAPTLEAARPIAEEELRFMREMCDDHDPNTLLAVERSLVASGVSESFRAIQPTEAGLDIVAIHGDRGD
ncbi:MAG: DUF6505 family protein [Paracoccaceae bacterium]